MRLEGKKAAVTGAGQGIGAAIARRLVEEGASVAILDLVEENASRLCDELSKAGVEVIAKRLDVTDSSEVEDVFKTVVEEFGGLDILVNNAGIAKDALLVRMSQEDWRSVLDVNLTGAFNCTKAVFRTMMSQRSGAIINIASVIGLIGNVGQTNYAASKAGIIGFTKALAKEAAPRGITVNAIAPGFIETKMTEKIPERARESLEKSIPLGRMGRPEDVASVVAFLVSSDAGYITGQVLHVDGGMVM